MKLNKLASLALAGLMAVSMLAGCKDNTAGGGQGGEVEVTPSSNYTQTVMDKTNDVTKAIFTGVADSKLDSVVDYVADNVAIIGIGLGGTDDGKDYPHLDDGYSTDALGHGGLMVLLEDGYGQRAAAEKMADAVYIQNCTKDENLEELIPEKEGKKTVYTLLRASRYLTDERIDNELADYMNEIADALSSKLIEAGKLEDCTYTVSMAKADSIVANEANRLWDSVLIGVVWQVEYAPETY